MKKKSQRKIIFSMILSLTWIGFAGYQLQIFWLIHPFNLEILRLQYLGWVNVGQMTALKHPNSEIDLPSFKSA